MKKFCFFSHYFPSSFLVVSLLACVNAYGQTITPNLLEGTVTRTSEKTDFHFNFKIALPIKSDSKDRYSLVYKSCQISNENGTSVPVDAVKLMSNSDFAEATYFDLMISGLKEPGIYKGEILFKIIEKDKPIDALLKVDLKVVSGVELEKSGDPAPVNMTNNVGYCPTKQGEIITNYTNKNSKTLPRIAGVEMMLHGRTSANAISARDIRPVNGEPVGNEVIISIVNREVPADTYTGWLDVSVEGLPKPIHFDNVTVKVKHGWFLVVVTILLGLVLGRLITLYNAPETQSYYKFMERVRDLRERLANTGGDGPVNERLSAVERKLRMFEFDNAVIDAELADIENIVVDREVEIKNKQIESEQQKGGSSSAELKDRQAELSGLKTTQGELDKLKKLRATHDNNFNRLVLKLTGLRVRSFVRNPLVQALIFLVTVLLVAGLGFTLHYANNPNFGEQGFVDYFNVLLWSSGSTAIIKSLFSLGS